MKYFLTSNKLHTFFKQLCMHIRIVYFLEELSLNLCIDGRCLPKVSLVLKYLPHVKQRKDLLITKQPFKCRVKEDLEMKLHAQLPHL